MPLETKQKSTNPGLLKNMTVYLTGSVATQCVGLAATILSRNFLGPLQTGVWSLVQIVLRYSSFSSLGAGLAASQEIPYFKGRNEIKKSQAVQNVSLCFGMTVAGVVAMGLALAAWIFRDILSQQVLITLLIAAALVLLIRFQAILISLLRAHKQFGLATKQMVATAFVNAALVIGLSYSYQLYGFVAAMCLSTVFNIIFVLMHRPFALNWHWDLKVIRGLVFFGLPLIALSMAGALTVTIDQIMIARWLGLEALGLYSIAVLCYRYLGSLPNAVGIVLSPHLRETYGQSGKPDALCPLVSQTATVLSRLMPLVIGMGCIWIASLLRVLLPAFTPAHAACQILILASFFFALHDPFSHLVVSLKRHMRLFPVIIGVSLAAIGFNWIAIQAGFGIAGIAWGTGLALFLKFTGAYIVGCASVFTRGAAWTLYFKILTRFVVLVTVLVCLEWGWGRAHLPFDHPLAKSVVFLLLYARVWKDFAFKAVRKAYRLTLHGLKQDPRVGRFLLFNDPQAYWKKRGGEKYFTEQESREDRTRTAEYIADEISRLNPSSVLEVGCGYGKNLKELRRRIPAKLYGVDYSHTQLDKARDYLKGLTDIELRSGEGQRLPYADHSIDVVFTSNVILHNPPDIADKMRQEILRVAKKYVVHKEDTDTNFSRFGYDHGKIYRAMGLNVIKCEQIAQTVDAPITQFTVVGK